MSESPKKKKKVAIKQEGGGGSQKSAKSEKAANKTSDRPKSGDKSRPKSGDKTRPKSANSGKGSDKKSKKGEKGKPLPKGKGKSNSSDEERPSTPEKSEGLNPQSLLYKYLCCFCCFRYKSRKVVRQQQNEAEKLKREAEEAERLRAFQNLPVQTIDEGLELQRKQEAAALRIQTVARRLQDAARSEVQRKKVRDEANEYWREVKRLHDAEQDRLNRIKMARKQFVEQYVSDVFITSVQYIIENDAVSLIQRTWRGHYARMHLPRRRKPRPPPRPPKPFVSRFSAATLRRVWARREFEPDVGYYHNTDVGYLDYNIWEYVDQPPLGNLTGLRTYKIPVIPRSDKDKQILLNNKHAWVGLPVGFETAEVVRERVYRNRSESVRKVSDKSPYLAKIVTYKDDVNNNKKNKKKVLHKEGSVDIDSSLDEEDEVSSGDEEEEGSEDEQEGNNITKQKASINKEEDNDDDDDSLAELRKLSQQKTSKVLSDLGFDDEKDTKLPKLGTITFDPLTGRKIIHKGGNKWAEINSGAIVSLEKYGNLQAELELRESIERSTELIANDSNSNNNSVILSSGYNLNHKSKVHHTKSGMISITNRDLSQNSTFLEQHKSAFLQEYSHHSLSDHNRSQQGGGVESDEDDDDELDREFNYIIPSLKASARTPPNTSIKPRDASFLTSIGMDVSNPAEYLTGEITSTSPQKDGLNASLVLLGNVKGYTEAGVPIRGARKPKGKNMNKLRAAAEASMGMSEAIQSKSLGYGPGYKPAAAAPRRNRLHKKTVSKSVGGSTLNSNHGGNGNDDASVWKSSSWGNVKKNVEKQLHNRTLQSQVFKHVVNNTDIGRLDLSGRGTSNMDNYSDYSDTEGGGDTRKFQYEIDSDEEMRSRNIYKPRKAVVSKVVVWPQKPMKHYRLKYTWIPQPLIHNAVNNLYYDKTIAEFQQSKETPSEVHYQSELNREKPRYIQTVNQLNMLSTVQTSYDEHGGDYSALEEYYDPMEASQLSDSLGDTGSFSPTSTKHAERQAQVSLNLPKQKIHTVPKHGPDSVSRGNEASTQMSSVTSFQDSNVSVASSISKYSYPSNKYRPDPPPVDSPTGKRAPTSTSVLSPMKVSSSNVYESTAQSPLKPHSIHRYNSMNTIAEDTQSMLQPTTDDYLLQTSFTSNHFVSSSERFPEEEHIDPTSSRKFKFKFKKNVSFKRDATIHPYEFY